MTAAPDIDTIAKDLATLKQDLAALMADLREGMVQRARDVGGETTDRVSEKAAAGVKALSHEIEERPLTALLCAFAVGFVASRLLTR